MIPEFEKIKAEFASKYQDVEGVLSIDLKENLLRVVVMDESICGSLPTTYVYEPQNFEIGIEYDTTARIAARELYRQAEAEQREREQLINSLVNAIESQD